MEKAPYLLRWSAILGLDGIEGAKSPVQEQNRRLSSYFDRISSGYSDRYGYQNPFHNYFFRQRLKAATDRFAFDGKSVVDIGGGTGALFDELIRRCPTVDYRVRHISGAGPECDSG